MADTPKFLTGNLFGHVTKMSLTASVGLMAVFFVDFLDMVFISMLGEAELAAAIGYAGAILFFTTSFSIGIAIAAGALTARAMGAGDQTLARQRATHALVYGVVAAAVFAAVVWINLHPIVALVGATGRTADLAVGYLQIVVPTLPFLLVGMCGGAILRAHGDARRAMLCTIYGGLVNAVLDPILIFGLGLELQGAALASVAARLTIAATGLLPIFQHHGGLCRPSLGSLMRDARPIFVIALPAILTQLATPVGQAYVTRAMAEFGESAVAGMAIVGRLTPVSFGVIFALSGAVGPIIGQNFGAGDLDRVRRAFRDALLFTGLVVVVVAASLFAVREWMVALFDATGDARTLVLLFCGPLALAFFFNGVIFVSNAAFNNLGRPFYSTLVNWGRHTLGTIPFVALGAWWLGAPGVLIGQAAGGLLFAGVALVLTWQVMGRPPKAARAEPFGRHQRLLNLFHNRR